MAELIDRGADMQELKDLVSLCLNKDPEDRPSAACLLKHKFFKVCGCNKTIYSGIGTSTEFLVDVVVQAALSLSYRSFVC